MALRVCSAHVACRERKDRPLVGHVEPQGHGQDLWFRNIHIRELPKAE